MTNAYDKSYLPRAQKTLGRMLDFACHELSYSAKDFWTHFLKSGVAAAFGNGESRLIAGMSGIELAYEVLDRCDKKYKRPADPLCSDEKSPEYWAAWALAQYQWLRGLTFSDIEAFAPIDDVIGMYKPYHEMDISQFDDELDRLYRKTHAESNLKRLRIQAGLSQSELANFANISIRTIQELEQGRKDINKAQIDTLLPIATALHVPVESLVERIPFAGVH